MVINQHFIPQFYLRHFSFGTKKVMVFEEDK